MSKIPKEATKYHINSYIFETVVRGRTPTYSPARMIPQFLSYSIVNFNVDFNLEKYIILFCFIKWTYLCPVLFIMFLLFNYVFKLYRFYFFHFQ